VKFKPNPNGERDRPDSICGKIQNINLEATRNITGVVKEITESAKKEPEEMQPAVAKINKQILQYYAQNYPQNLYQGEGAAKL
jgi:hypothetical protein